MVANTPSHGWRYPTLGDQADANLAFQQAMLDIEATVDAPGVQAYTPSWTATGSQPSNLLTNIGRYRLSGGYCTVTVHMSFGASTSGGTGTLIVSLPLPVSSAVPEQTLTAKLWMPTGGAFMGIGVITGTVQSCVPYFPSPTDTRMNPWASAAIGSGAGTGVPAIGGVFSVQNGGNFTLSGRYLTA